MSSVADIMARFPAGSIECVTPEVDAILAEENAWPEPEPIVPLSTAAPYLEDTLPAVIREAVEEVQGFVQAPMALVAGCALSAVSTVVQGHADVARLTRLKGPASLFMLTIAESGERKSTCDGFFRKTIEDYEREQREALQPALAAYEADSAVWDAKRLALLEKLKGEVKAGKDSSALENQLDHIQGQKPEKPKVPRLLFSGDMTPEALAHTLAKEWPVGAIISAEAGILFGSHGMNRDAIMRNLATLNLFWDGARHTVDRRTSESFVIDGARLTMSLQVQGATLKSFLVANGELARGTGWLARFLIAAPESTMGTRLINPDNPDGPNTWPALARFHKRMKEILEKDLPIDETGKLAPEVLTLGNDARAIWIAFHNSVERKLGDGGTFADVKDVAAKVADNAARLAALFTAFQGEEKTIDALNMESACTLSQWYLREAQRFLGMLGTTPSELDAIRLDSWLRTYCRSNGVGGVGRSHTMQNGPLRNKARLDGALNMLTDLGRVMTEQVGGRWIISVHPALVEGMTES